MQSRSSMLSRTALALLASLSYLPAAVQAQPAAKVVTLVNGFPPGGSSDLSARAMTTEMSAALGSAVIVRNVPGAGGALGASEVARSRPDGSTLLFTLLGSIVSQPHLRKLEYGIDSFIPVCMYSDTPQYLVAAKNSKFATIRDVIDAARAAPARVAYASLGVASFPHIIGESFARASGISLLHVPFKGASQFIQAMLSGDVALVAEQPAIIAQYDLRPLAIFTAQRAPDFPQVPTMRELGFDLVYQIWGGIFAPAATPAEVIDRLDLACRKSLASAATGETLRRMHVNIRYMGNKEFGPFVRAEFERYGKLFRSLELKQME